MISSGWGSGSPSVDGSVDDYPHFIDAERKIRSEEICPEWVGGKETELWGEVICSFSFFITSRTNLYHVDVFTFNHQKRQKKWCWKSFLPTNLACQCQLMVIGTNSVPTGIPTLGCGEEGNVLQCEKLHCDWATAWGSTAVRQFWGDAPLWLDNSALPALLHMLFSALVWQDLLGVLSLVLQLQLQSWCFSSSTRWRNAVFILWWKGKVHSRSQREASLDIFNFLKSSQMYIYFVDFRERKRKERETSM